MLSLLTSRLARNVYFWAVVIYFSTDFSQPLWQSLFRLGLFAIEIALVYFNNLLIVPRLLARKKYAAYSLSLVVATFILACAYVLLLKMMLHFHPDAQVNSVNVIHSTPPDAGLTLAATLKSSLLYFFPLLTLTVTFTLAWYAMNYVRQQNAASEAEKKQVEAELKFLKGQINPHFLFNTLNNLYGLAMEGAREMPESILKLSSILRYLLYESNAKAVPFEKEKDVMLAYIDLELLRTAGIENRQFLIDADAAYHIPPLLWLPVLENIFKHGTPCANGEQMIDFRLAIRQGKLSIFSKNSFDPQTSGRKSPDASGIGLANLKQRLDLLFPGKCVFDIREDDKYYIVNIEIELT